MRVVVFKGISEPSTATGSISWANTMADVNYFVTRYNADVFPVGTVTGYDNVSFAAIPEPAAMGLMAFGGLMLLRRRR